MHKKQVYLQFFLGVIFPFFAAAQDEMLERLTGESFQNEIYLQIRNDQINYKLDPLIGIRDDDGFVLPKDDKILWSAHSPKVKLRFGFYNPYKYTVSVQQDIQDDPVNESAEKFIEALSTYLSFITVGTPSNYNDSGLAKQPTTTPKSLGGAVATSIAAQQYFTTPSIVQWYLWLKQNETEKCAMDAKELESLISSIGEIEKRLYHKFDIQVEGTKKTESLSDHVSIIVNDVYVPNDVEKFKQKYQASVLYKQSFQIEIEKLKEYISIVDRIEKNLKIGPENSDYCKIFNTYTHQTLVQYIGEIQDKYKKVNIIIENLNSFLDIGNKFIESNTITNSLGIQSGLSYREELLVDYKSLRTVTITVKKLEINLKNIDVKDNDKNVILKEKLEYKRAFRLVRFRKTWAEASTGLFYSNIGYPSYSTMQDGTNLVVAEPTIQKPRAIVALFYNQVFNTQTYPVFPFLQIGLATGKDYPTLLVGGGIRLISKDSKRFSISGGLALPFTQELDTLVPKKSIVLGQADIDKDIRYRLGSRIGFYLGFAWKL